MEEGIDKMIERCNYNFSEKTYLPFQFKGRELKE